MTLDTDLRGAAALDEAKRSRAESAARECLRRTLALVWCMARYPPGNKAIQEASEAWQKAMDAMLRDRDSFLLAVLEGQLYFEDTPLGTHDEMSARFVRELFDRRIRKVVFRRGTAQGDLGAFARVMGTDARELLKAGGAKRALEKLGVKSIEIVEDETRQAEAPDKEHWEAKLDRLGLSRVEVLAYVLGKGRLPRLLTDELRLLVEAMKDPVFLSQIIVHLATDDRQAGEPSPREIIRLLKRCHYILLANALFDPKEAPRALRRAMEALGGPLRQRLLAEKLRQDASGARYVEDAFLGFADAEYARYAMAALERTGDWRLAAARVRFGAERAARVGRAFRAELLASTAWRGDAGEVARMARAFLACVGGAVPVRPPSDPGFLPVVRRDGLSGEAIESAARRCLRDFEQGYVCALLYLLDRAERSVEEILAKLIDVLEHRIAMGRLGEALDVMAMVLARKTEEARLLRYRRGIQSLMRPARRRELLGYLAERLLGGDEAVVPRARLMATVFGEELCEQTIAAYYRDAALESNPALIEFLGPNEARVMPALSERTRSRDPLDRAKAVELMAAFDSEKARGFVLDALEDPDHWVRLIAIFTMGCGASHRGGQRLMEMVAARSGGEVAGMERCAAALALGSMGFEPAIPLLRSVLAKRRLFASKADRELKACAARALGRIPFPGALAALDEHVDRIGASPLGAAFRRRRRLSGRAPDKEAPDA